VLLSTALQLPVFIKYFEAMKCASMHRKSLSSDIVSLVATIQSIRAYVKLIS
jgi:hypothetical protein